MISSVHDFPGPSVKVIIEKAYVTCTKWICVRRSLFLRGNLPAFLLACSKSLFWIIDSTQWDPADTYILSDIGSKMCSLSQFGGNSGHIKCVDPSLFKNNDTKWKSTGYNAEFIGFAIILGSAWIKAFGKGNISRTKEHGLIRDRIWIAKWSPTLKKYFRVELLLPK